MGLSEAKRQVLNGQWLFYPDVAGNLDVFCLSSVPWQPITVPGVWEGRFTFDGVPVKLLRARLNDGDWVSHDLSAYPEGEDCRIEVELPVAALREGANAVVIDSTIRNPDGAGAESFYLYAAPTSCDSDGGSSLSHDLAEWTPLDGSLQWCAELALGRDDDSERSKPDAAPIPAAARASTDRTALGHNAAENKRYYARQQFQARDISRAATVKLRLDVHIGRALVSTYADPYLYDGVGWYRNSLSAPELQAGRMAWLTFEAVDYVAEVWLNGRFVGSHEGGYTPFRLNVTDALIPGRDNELAVRVTDQTDPRFSTAQGAIPVKETNAGFLQDTIAVNYGGIWQDVYLETTADVRIDEMSMVPDIDRSNAEARVTVGNYSGRTRQIRVAVGIRPSAGGAFCGRADTALTLQSGECREARLAVGLSSPRWWSPSDPYLYTADVSIAEETNVLDERNVEFGMRKVGVSGAKLMFNNREIFLTGMLHWGLYWDTVAELPTREQVRREIRDLKTAGFNAIKFCLFDPPSYVLSELDRAGMYAYIEYPIWYPKETEAFFARSRRHIREMLAKDRNHPSLILIDFNCEMHHYTDEMDALMKELYELGHAIAPGRLYLDNSGCGITRYGDFAAVHPYNQLNKFAEAIDRYAASRTEAGDKPVVLGEFADSDTIRDTSAVRAAHGGELPWWWTLFGTKDPETILAGQGYDTEQIRLLRSFSVAHAEMAKKHYIEEAKKNAKVAGLFVTHIRDIAQTQAGFYDDNGRLKFDATALRRSAAETVLLLDRQTQNVWGGTAYACTPLLSHYDGTSIRGATIRWRLVADAGNGERAVAEGVVQSDFAAAAGGVYRLRGIRFDVPLSDRPQTYTLAVSLETEDGSGYDVSNRWTLWAYPPKPLDRPSALEVRVFDPANKLELHERYPWMRPWGSELPCVLVATEWNADVERYWRNGGRVLYAGCGDGPVAVREGTFNTWSFPFMAEAHAALGDFPHAGFGGQQFFELATPYHLDGAGKPEDFIAAPPIVGRMELREYRVDSYLSEFVCGEGILLWTTLRLDGKPVRHKDSITDYQALYQDECENVAGRYLFDRLLAYLLAK